MQAKQLVSSKPKEHPIGQKPLTFRDGSSGVQISHFIGEGAGGVLLALGWNCSQWVKARIIFSQKTPAASV